MNDYHIHNHGIYMIHHINPVLFLQVQWPIDVTRFLWCHKKIKNTHALTRTYIKNTRTHNNPMVALLSVLKLRLQFTVVLWFSPCLWLSFFLFLCLYLCLSLFVFVLSPPEGEESPVTSPDPQRQEWFAQYFSFWLLQLKSMSTKPNKKDKKVIRYLTPHPFICSFFLPTVNGFLVFTVMIGMFDISFTAVSIEWCIRC